MRLIKFLLFNRFVKSYLNGNYRLLASNKRANSLVLELRYTLSVFFPYLVILIIPTMFFGDPVDIEPIDLPVLTLFNFMFLVLLNKDFFSGQSVVHRSLGYQVVDSQSKEPASKVKCMLRNVTAPLWPIEAIVALVNPQRRLGDFIANTCLIEVPPSNPELILNEIKRFTFNRQAKWALFLSITWVIAFMVLFDPRIRLW